MTFDEPFVSYNPPRDQVGVCYIASIWPTTTMATRKGEVLATESRAATLATALVSKDDKRWKRERVRESENMESQDGTDPHAMGTSVQFRSREERPTPYQANYLPMRSLTKTSMNPKVKEESPVI